MHVTLRAARGLPSLRSERIRARIEEVIDRARKETGQVVHFAIQRDHVHLMIEAQDKRALSSCVRRVVIAFARRLNHELGRKKGKVWGDRYHRRDLGSPREVKNCLLYLFTNAAKHGEEGASRLALDRCSSALGFDRWAGIPASMMEAFMGDRVPWKPPKPRTWLLGTGWWKVHGPLVLGDAARGARG